MVVRWIAFAAALCDVVVARTGPAAGLPWVGHAAIVIAVATGLIALAPAEERARVIGTLAAVANVYVLCALALFGLCAEIDFFGETVLRVDFAVAAAAALVGAALDVTLALCADRLAPRIPPAHVR